MMRRFLAPVLGLVLTGGSLSAMVVVSSGTAQGATTATYSCSAPVVGNQDSTTTFDSTLPEVVYAGDLTVHDVEVTTSGVARSSATGTAWSLLGARKMESGSTLPLTLGSLPEKQVAVAGSVTPINNGGDTTLLGRGTYGTWVAPATPQLVELKMAKKYGAVIKMYKDNGTSQTSYSPTNSECTWKSGSLVVDTVKVMASSTTTATASALQITEGDALEVSSEVTVSAGTTAGKVEFKAGEKKLQVNLVNGKAAGTITGLEAGSYPLTATFVPTQPALYEASASAELLATVSPAVPATPTTASLVLERSQVTSAEQAKATLTVTSEAGTPAGQARVVVNGKVVTAPLSGGSATLTLPTLRAGNYQVTGGYVPDDIRQFAASSAAPSALVVVAGAGGDVTPTSVWLEPSRTTVPVGSTLSVTARVTSQGEAPKGKVVFSFDQRTMSAPVVNGRAVVSLPYLPIGSYQVAAEFVPATGSGFEPSQAEPRSFAVLAGGLVPPAGPLATTTTLSVPATALPGVGFGVRATVRGPSGATPNGTVTFRAGTTSFRAELRAGVATATLRITQLGVTPVTATFTAKDAGVSQPSLGSAFVTVAKATSTTRVTAVIAKRKVTVRARVSSAGNRCAVPVTVTLTRGAVLVKKTAKASCAGVATVNLKARSAGKWRVTATTVGNSTMISSKAITRVTAR